MKKIALILVFLLILIAGAWWTTSWKSKRISSITLSKSAGAAEEEWIEDFNEKFDKNQLSSAWRATPLAKSISKIELKDSSLILENSNYSPYSEIWLTKKYEGPVRIEFDLQLRLKQGGEFGVRVANSQTEILPNTPGYEVYLVSMNSAIIKRADRDEQVNTPVTLPVEAAKGEKFIHFTVEKTYRKVRLFLGENLMLEYPDPEVLSGKKFPHCGFFLIAGQAAIKNLSVLTFSKKSESDMLAQAYEFYTGADYGTALDLYERFLKEEPESKRSLEARFRRALCQKYLENYSESVRLLQGLQFNIVDQEYVPDALFFLGEIYQKIRQFENAEKYYSGFIERFSKHPYVPKAYERLSICQWSLKKYPEVLQTTDALLKEFPQSITAVHSRYLRGEVYESLKEKEKAKKEYATLLNLVQKDLVANLARKRLRKLESESQGAKISEVQTFWRKNSLEIVYAPSPAAPLKDAQQMMLHWGRNSWQQVQETAMTKSAKGWEVRIPFEKEIRSIEFVFTDGQGNWDNNNGLNWELDVPNKGR